MSGGPIQRERDAWKSLRVSTPDAQRVCFRAKAGVGYCGRRSAKALTDSWGEVVCWDCTAAALADGIQLPEGVAA